MERQLQPHQYCSAAESCAALQWWKSCIVNFRVSQFLGGGKLVKVVLVQKLLTIPSN